MKNIWQRLLSMVSKRPKPTWHFDDYNVLTGYTNAGHIPYASIREFFALSALGKNHQEAIDNLRVDFQIRVTHMQRESLPIPAPGDPAEEGRFAPNDQVESLRPFVDEFWSEILGTSYSISFVSNESTLNVWEHYVGGRSELVKRIIAKYGVDISKFYNKPIPFVLKRIQRKRRSQNKFT